MSELTSAIWIAVQLVAIQPAPVQVSATLVAAVAAGAVLVIGAIVTGALQIIREIRATKQLVVTSAQVGAEVGQKRDQTLSRIEVLVDGRYGEVLQELADMKLLLATATGVPSDLTLAENAQKRADAQQVQVAAANVNKTKETP